ncbi:MAG TPA: hypothetical protein VEC06_20355 [Paucimonas sp.]|nr:hypothetical protein [Paucimonas sp.]
MTAKQCSDGVSDYHAGTKNGSDYGKNKNDAIDCMMNPRLCKKGKTAQDMADASEKARRDNIKNATDATKNLGMSVPGTTWQGPVPTSVGDVAADIVPNTMGP